MEEKIHYPLTTIQFPFDDVRRSPDEQVYDVRLKTWMSSGDDAINMVRNYLPTDAIVGVDIETEGSDGVDRFRIKCVTATWENHHPSIGGTYFSVILDPRVRTQAAAIRTLTDNAAFLVFQGGTFDIPPLVVYELMALDSIDKVWDTLVLARQLTSSDKGGRTLEDLVTRFTDMKDSKIFHDKLDKNGNLSHSERNIVIADTFEAMGFSRAEDGYREMDVQSPVYRMGAMSDTLGTLRIFQPLYTAILDLYVNDYAINDPFDGEDYRAKAVRLIEREQKVNKAMLRRSALGIKVDMDYLEKYSAEVEEFTSAERQGLMEFGINPDAGNANLKFLEVLEKSGELPDDWPRTESGNLSATKDDLENIDHPLVKKLIKYRFMTKVKGYLVKVAGTAALTGRVHPQVQVLGASSTGRMSYTNPELQQFPDEARPILHVDEGGSWVSVDWSSVEPVVVGNASGDTKFLEPFLNGFDLYVPIAKQLGLIPMDMPEEEAAKHPMRKRVKRIFLATLYGQGPKSLAKELGITEKEAREAIDGIYAQLPKVEKFIKEVKAGAGRTGVVRTLDGRVLSIPKDPERGFLAYKSGNYVVQGTAYSMLSEVIAKLYDMGISDAIFLAVHDEIVLDASFRETIQGVMETAPEWLVKAAGHEVVLKSDANLFEEGYWKYV